MPLKVFCCYAHEDEPLLNKLRAHLSPLQRQGMIDFWYNRDINAGTEWESEIKEHLDSAQIILLLISADFINSDYCYGKEMQRALERHKRKEVRVIPIILRHVYWQSTLGDLQALPTDGKPVTDPEWHSLDRAFFSVVEGICKVIREPMAETSLTEQSVGKSSMPSFTATSIPSPQALFAEPENLFTNTFQKFSLFCSLEGHKNDVAALAISPDRQTLISSSWDATIKIWDLRTFELLHTLRGDAGYVWSVATSSNGRILASGHARGRIKIWHLTTGHLFRSFQGHQNTVYSVAISPDNQTLVSSSHDTTINVWNLSTGQFIRSLREHRDAVRSVSISSDGQTLVSGSKDMTIKVWDLNTGKLHYSLAEHQEAVNSISISSDGQMFISGSKDKTIKVWHLPTGKLLRSIIDDDYVTSVAINPDGQTLVSGSYDKTIKVWNFHTCQLLHTLKGHEGPIFSVIISPDGHNIFSGSKDKSIKVWEKMCNSMEI